MSQVFKGMKENQYYQEKHLYFLYMLCSEGARGLSSQDGERNGKRCSSKMEQGQGDKRKQRDQGEKVSGNDPKLGMITGGTCFRIIP